MTKNRGELDYGRIAHDIGDTLKNRHGIDVSELNPVDYECEVCEFIDRMRRAARGVSDD